MGFWESVKLEGPREDDVEVRAFGESAELRWRRDGDLWQALLLSDGADCPAPTGFTSEAEYLIRYGEPIEYVLWGERDKEGTLFREGQRLPLAMHYPGVTASYAAIQVALYRVDTEDNPLPSIIRYMKLVSANLE